MPAILSGTSTYGFPRKPTDRTGLLYLLAYDIPDDNKNVRLLGWFVHIHEMH